jgi:hypothetical protein
VSTQISQGDLQFGDVLINNNPSYAHAVIFGGWTDGSQVSTSDNSSVTASCSRALTQSFPFTQGLFPPPVLHTALVSACWLARWLAPVSVAAWQ